MPRVADARAELRGLTISRRASVGSSLWLALPKLLAGQSYDPKHHHKGTKENQGGSYYDSFDNIYLERNRFPFFREVHYDLIILCFSPVQASDRKAYHVCATENAKDTHYQHRYFLAHQSVFGNGGLRLMGTLAVRFKRLVFILIIISVHGVG